MIEFADSFDVTVVGLGAMGSAAAYQFAKAGRSVLALDRFNPPHTLGSSHGQTRIIREAYFEHPLYVPLVQRAYELWDDLQAQSGRELFRQTGGLMIGPENGVVFPGAKRSAETHHLEHEILSAREVRRRFPALQPTDPLMAVWEPRAGVLFPEACIEAHLRLARQLGATVHTDEAVQSWEVEADAVRVVTDKGSYSSGQILFCAGPWTASLLSKLDLPLQIERQVQFWFEPRGNPDRFRPERCPIHIWETEPEFYFYGFPDLGQGVKLAMHHQGSLTNPDALDRAVKDAEIEGMRALARKHLPEAAGTLRSTAVCMYTNTPDGHFLVDWHPEFPQVLIASPCSGHGFKFASAMGEVLAELLTTRTSQFDLSLFGLGRLRKLGPTA